MANLEKLNPAQLFQSVAVARRHHAGITPAVGAKCSHLNQAINHSCRRVADASPAGRRRFVAI